MKNISEKEKLRQLIFAELEDKTDVEVQPIVNDDISDYIKQTRNKESMFNYTPSDSEL